MPMRKDLERIHQELEEIKRESETLAHKKYTSQDVQHLQARLHRIDAQYKEGIIDDRDKKNMNDDPYEHPGQAQIADDLANVHQTLSELLGRTR